MITPHHLDRTTGPTLKKSAAITVLAGGLAMAVIGLTPAMANADPAPLDPPSPTITATLLPTAPPPGRAGSDLCIAVNNAPRDHQPNSLSGC